jgi:hypothetical protein
VFWGSGCSINVDESQKSEEPPALRFGAADTPTIADPPDAAPAVATEPLDTTATMAHPTIRCCSPEPCAQPPVATTLRV